MRKNSVPFSLHGKGQEGWRRTGKEGKRKGGKKKNEEEATEREEEVGGARPFSKNPEAFGPKTGNKWARQ